MMNDMETVWLIVNSLHDILLISQKLQIVINMLERQCTIIAPLNFNGTN